MHMLGYRSIKKNNKVDLYLSDKYDVLNDISDNYQCIEQVEGECVMKNFEKYERQYFMPPEVTYDWVKKEYVDHPPIWCSVDKRWKPGAYRAYEP